MAEIILQLKLSDIFLARAAAQRLWIQLLCFTGMMLGHCGRC
jgi:hypothetical protein